MKRHAGGGNERVRRKRGLRQEAMSRRNSQGRQRMNEENMKSGKLIDTRQMDSRVRARGRARVRSGVRREE